MSVNVMFGNPTEGHSPPESYHNRLLMMFHLGKLEAKSEGKFAFFVSSAGRLFTPMAREKLADTALKGGMDYLFMVDDDMVCPIDLFERLYRHNVDIVAALAFTRNPPYLPVLYNSTEGYDSLAKRDYCFTSQVRSYPKDKLVECDAVGFGAVLIRLEVLKKVETPWFMTASGTGEDILFCLKARKAGFKVFMDTSTRLGHIGAPIIVDETRADEMNKPEEMERLYGPYKKYGVYDVCHLPQVDGPVVLAGRD